MVDAELHVFRAELESARRTRDQAKNELLLAKSRLDEAEAAFALAQKAAKDAGL